MSYQDRHELPRPIVYCTVGTQEDSQQAVSVMIFESVTSPLLIPANTKHKCVNGQQARIRHSAALLQRRGDIPTEPRSLASDIM